MKLIQTKLLFDGINEQKDCYIGIEKGNIKFVGNIKPSGNHEIIANVGAITPSFIDAHSHIGMIRSGEQAREEETNEQMDSIVFYLMLCIVYIWMILLFMNLLK